MPASRDRPHAPDAPPTAGAAERPSPASERRWNRLPRWTPVPVAVFLVTLSLILTEVSPQSPSLVLAACLVVSALLTLTLWLTQLSLRRTERLATANRELAAEVERRRLADARVRELNWTLADRVRELEAANRELESFSYSASHDLRAPLRHLVGFADLLQQSAGDRLDEQGRRYLGVIRDAAIKMGELIDGLLTFSRAGRVEINRQRVELEPLVRDVIETLKPGLKGREIEWQVDRLPPVHADPVLLRTVLQNLLENAAKFTRGRTPARIQFGVDAENGGGPVFWVRDNGAGFEPEYIPKLFGIFQRLHRQDEFEGTGVGLANVQRIVHRHGGTVWAEGEVDSGATFYFTLPAGAGGGPR